MLPAPALTGKMICRPLSALRQHLIDHADRAGYLAPPRRKNRGAKRGCELCLGNSPLPDVPGQENGRRGTGQAGEPASAEAKHPGGELRGPAELVERDAEQ